MPTADAVMETARRDAIDLLLRDEGASIPEIADHVGLSREDARELVCDLDTEFEMGSSADFRYRILGPATDAESGVQIPLETVMEIIEDVEEEVLAEDKLGATREMMVEGTCTRLRRQMRSSILDSKQCCECDDSAVLIADEEPYCQLHASLRTVDTNGDSE